MTSARSVLLPLVLTLGAAAAAGCRGLGDPPPRPVVLVTVDTLRADRVGLHGFAFPTPALDAVGREGAWAATAYAPFARTTQSVGSILTGLHPLRHGGDGLGMRLPDSATTLAERFKQRGYDTAAFVTNIVLQPGFGFEQGFDLFSNPEPRWVGNSAFSLTGEAVAWLRSRPKDGKPFFLWVHYLDPHWSYEPRDEFARRTDPSGAGAGDLASRVESGAIPWGRMLFDAPSVLTPAEIEQARRMYDAEVLQTDAAVGQFVAALKELGYWDGAVLAFASDHGESLGEHDYWFGHGEYLYDTTLHVPLMLRAAGEIPPGTRIDGVVRLEDLAPTVLALSGAPVPAGLDGVDLAPLLRRGGTVVSPRPTAVHLTDHLLIRSENPRRPVAGREGRWWALRDGSLKLIRIPAGPGRWDEELYDLAADPGETTNLAGSRAAEAGRLRQQLQAISGDLLKDAPTDDGIATHPDADRLRSLGYAR